MNADAEKADIEDDAKTWLRRSKNFDQLTKKLYGSSAAMAGLTILVTAD